MKRFKLDDCLDAHGFNTLRLDDGSEHGATDAQPVATIYSDKHSRLLASAGHLAETLLYVLRAHDYDGALTTGNAILSPAIRGRIVRELEGAGIDVRTFEQA